MFAVWVYLDLKQYQNALTFTLTFPGIPIIYYGSEQEYSGCSDPNNREVLWPSRYNVNATFYMLIEKIVHARKALSIWDQEFNVVSSQDTFYAYNRGEDFLVCLTNVGDNTGTDQYSVGSPGLSIGTKYCNIFWPSVDCFTYLGGDLAVYLLNGESKIYVNTNLFSEIEGFDISVNLFGHNWTYWGDDPMYTVHF